MTTQMMSWTPSYLRRAPRWYDGSARLMDLGCAFDLRLPLPPGGVDAEAMAEDIVMVRQDLQQALEQLALGR